MRRFPPRRLICLTEETVETLHLLGEQDRIVGVSGYDPSPESVPSPPCASTRSWRSGPTLGALIGESDKAEALACSLEARVTDVARATKRSARPRVYFEEWNDPMISAIGWVSELIEVAGGDEVFARLRGAAAARDRLKASMRCARRYYLRCN